VAARALGGIVDGAVRDRAAALRLVGGDESPTASIDEPDA
jgi:hypothetical protein